MAFPFKPQKDKSTFQYTFLNEVALKIGLPESMDKISFEKMQSFFKRLFNLDFKESHREYILNTRLKVENQDNGIIFEFSKSTIKISIEQNHYNTFNESMRPLLSKLNEAYIEWFPVCKDLELKYVDVWPLTEERNLQESKIKELEDAIFSIDLRTQTKETDKNFRGNHWEDNDIILSMQYGYYISKDDSQNSGIALESRCEYSKEYIEINRIIPMVSKMNSILYDAFIWAVTPQILFAMEGKTVG